MRKAWLLILGVLILVGTGISFLGNEEQSTETRLNRFSALISEDLNKEVGRMQTSIESLYNTWKEEGSFQEGVTGEWVCIVLDEKKEVVAWSEAENFPPTTESEELANAKDQALLFSGNKVYYCLNQVQGEGRFVALLPLFISYKVKNNFLPTRAFLGRFQNHRKLNQQLKGIQKSVLPGSANRIKIQAAGIEYYIELEDATRIAQKPGKWAVSGFVLGLILLFAGLYMLLKDKLGSGKAGGLALGSAILVRGLMLSFSFPADFTDIRLFSPSLLAINEWNPSLGDLSLNVMVLFGIAIYLSRALFRSSPLWIKKISGNQSILYTVHFLFSGLSVGLFILYFFLLDSLVRNSRVSLDLTDIFRVNIHTVIFLSVVTMLLSSILLIIFQLLRPGIYAGRKSTLSMVIAMGISLLTGLAGGLIFFPEEPGVIVAIFIGLAAIFILHRMVKKWSILRLDFLNYMIIALAMTFVLAMSLQIGSETRRKMEMEAAASRLSEERDLVVETMFNRTLSELVDESLVLQFGLYPDSITGNLNKWLRDQFFDEAFKGYDLNLFLVDEIGSSISPNFSSIPRQTINPDSGLQYIGEATLSPNLKLVRDPETLLDYYYLGWFDLIIGKMGKLYVQVELIPNSFDQNRIYPQLILDDVVRDRSVFEKFIHFGIYRSGKLIQKNGMLSFPLIQETPEGLEEGEMLWKEGDQMESLFYRTGENRMVIVKAEKTGFFHLLNTFSFIFYYFLLLFLIVQVPVMLSGRFGKDRALNKLSFRAKVQIFLLAISVLPLVAVIFFLPPFTTDKFSKEVQTDLMEETARVGQLLKEDFLMMTAPGPFDAGLYRSFRNRLEQLERDLFNDINIYDADGKIRFSTRQEIFELGLTSGRMNPDVLRSISSGKVSEMVAEERIGNLTYFSSYYPFYSEDREIVGYLNMPYLSQKDTILEEYLGLIAYIVDIYVLIFLAVGLIGFFLTDAILLPLTLLRRKMEGIRLGNKNEPIEWRADDEIGEIIGAYNRMVEDLAVSEKKLAQSQREEAWQQMARQVAHEIKNPLTPMRLSIQHLIRSWKSGDGNMERKFEKVSQTLLRQIDSLVSISNSFSEFAKMPEPQKSVFDLREVLEEIVHLYEHDDKVQLKMHLPDEPFIVNSDRDQLSRVFNNLVKNGIQAIEHEEGLVVLKLEINRPKATVSVTDNGKGIPEELKDRIFQPNFSTKTSGMGLGLAIVRRIIENAGGEIYFESTAGEGTTFYVDLFESKQEIS